MNKEDKKIIIAHILGIIGIVLITIGITLTIIENINKTMCYDMPLNEFYSNKHCMKYWEERK